MRKILYLTIFCFIILGLTGCLKNNEDNSNNSDNNINENSENNIGSDDKLNKDSKSLVLYFSATGTTKGIAEKIAKVSNSDIIEIIPKEKYTSSDLNYNNNNSRANQEQNNKSARPEIKNNIVVTDYDVIYLGYPIWWNDTPKIILTFLDTHDLEGKTIIPFCTSGSSGIIKSQNTLESYNKNINWLKGERFSSNISEEELLEWIKKL